MAKFATTLTWKAGTQEAELTSAGKPPIAIMPPPEFGGKEGYWSPEDALIGAIQSCLLLTTLYFVSQQKIDLQAYDSETTGSLSKTPQGLRFAEISVAIRAQVGSEEDAGKMKQAVAQAEKFCPVSAAVSAPVTVTLVVTTA
ncbi:MAG: OsmC family protein [Verrucomicrobia bacterium]|nr:OsmC family protein [Verrucomicrobiota bacterium]